MGRREGWEEGKLISMSACPVSPGDRQRRWKEQELKGATGRLECI